MPDHRQKRAAKKAQRMLARRQPGEQQTRGETRSKIGALKQEREEQGGGGGSVGGGGGKKGGEVRRG